MAKQNKNNDREVRKFMEYEKELLELCGLTKRGFALGRTFQELIDAVNIEDEDFDRVKAIEKFLENKKYTVKEKALLLFCYVEFAYCSGKKYRADKKKAA